MFWALLTSLSACCTASLKIFKGGKKRFRRGKAPLCHPSNMPMLIILVTLMLCSSIWQKPLIKFLTALYYKLSHYGISGNLLIWIQDFLNNRYQTVVLKGEHSTSCRCCWVCLKELSWHPCYFLSISMTSLVL